jgi:inhibitor of KinA sporulation pathway (predicted exonuclease)
MRTIVDLAEVLTNFDKRSVEFEGEKHNAISDAVHQAKVIHKAYMELLHK